MEQEISSLINQGFKSTSDFEVLETIVRDISLRVGARNLETIMNADKRGLSADNHPSRWYGNELYQKTSENFIPAFGDISLERTFYTNWNGWGYFPRDKKSKVENETPCSKTMYMGMDDTGYPVTSKETEGRKGKQPDGSYKTREVKLAIVFGADSWDKNDKPASDEESVTYNAAIESTTIGDHDKKISDFTCKIERVTQRLGFDKAEQLVIIGDGAA